MSIGGCQRSKLSLLLLATLLATCGRPQQALPVLRKAPELTINQPNGASLPLSSLKGKVVVIEFLFVKSKHCLRIAQALTNLYTELGPRGFEPIGIAFDAPNAASTGGEYLGTMVEAMKISYPMGYSDKTAVDGFLGRTGRELLAIPQIVVIDREGNIRAATGGRTDATLEEESSLRALLQGLLMEPAPSQG